MARPMKKNFGVTNPPKKIQPKKLAPNIVNVSDGLDSYNMITQGQHNRPRNTRPLTNQNLIRNTGPGTREPIKLNPKYTFNLNGMSNTPNPHAFQKKSGYAQGEYTEVNRVSSSSVKQPVHVPNLNLPKRHTTTYRPGGSSPYQFQTATNAPMHMHPRSNAPYTSNAPPKKKSTPGMQNPGMNALQSKNRLYAPRSKNRGNLGSQNSWNSKSENIRNSVSSQYSQKSDTSILRTGKSPGGNRSILAGRQTSPMNPLKTQVFLDTSATSPRKIRLPNSRKPNMMATQNQTKKIILNKAKFHKKSAKKITSEIISEEAKKPTKNRHKERARAKEARESHGKITSRIIDELVTENRQVEREYRANSRIRKKQEQFIINRELEMPKLDTANWQKVDQININNINSFGLDKHDRFPGGHKFSLQKHKANDGEKPNWLMSKYNELFGKEQYKNSEFTIPKELKNYAEEYRNVEPGDLKKILVKEQIRDSFDHFLLEALMNWTPQSNRRQKGLGDSFERLEAQNAFGESVQRVRRKDQTKIKSMYWKQKEVQPQGSISRERLRELRREMKEARDTLNIIQFTAKQPRFQRRNQEINFSPEEIKKFFLDSNHERMVFFFTNYRGILVVEDIDDNVLFIENQLHGVEDQLNSMMFKQRQKNGGRERLFQTDTERFARDAAKLGLRVRLMRETLRVAKKVGTNQESRRPQSNVGELPEEAQSAGLSPRP